MYFSTQNMRSTEKFFAVVHKFNLELFLNRIHIIDQIKNLTL
jgi:hypothetical protein